MADIKLFVCCHRPTVVPEHPLLVPIQVGAALAENHFPEFLHDDTCRNISDKNRAYCELTAQYWAWKNADADFYGFFHYRRYLYPDLAERRPYRIEAEASGAQLNKLGFSKLESLIPQYDLILPKGENMRSSVREHYAQAPFHHRKDLELVEQIVQARHPEMVKAVNEYLSNPNCYFGNIFIMRRLVFYGYCSWLFPILEEFDHRADLTGYSPQELRVDGYLAERLLGIYALHHRELRNLELPRVHFIEDAAERRKKQVVNFLLPPGSVRRSKVKSWKR